MLPRKHRLALRSQPNFFSTAQKQLSPSFIIFYQPGANQSLRATVVVPKKAYTKAVVRNTMRRKATEVVQALLPKYSKCDLAVVISFRRNAAQQDWEQLKPELHQLLSQLLEENC